MRFTRLTGRHRLPNIRLNPTVLHGRRSWWRPWMRRTAYGLAGVLLVIGIFSAYYVPKLWPVKAIAKEAERTAKGLAKKVSAQDFAGAHQDVTKLQANVAEIQGRLDRTKGLRAWPYMGRQYTAAVGLAEVGQRSLEAVGPLIDFMDNLFKPFAGRGKISLASITPAEKGTLLGDIASHEENLKAAQVAIHSAAAAMDKVSDRGLIGPLDRVIVPLKQQFPLITQALDQAIPTTHLLPPLLGYPQAKTYLFLLQNNTEIRPSGGFIGTYGLMKISAGEIVSMQTDNSYNLDEAAKKLPVVPPPDALRKYLKQNAWYFRDSNWSPDFPTSAQQALFFYQREGGSRNVDGVVAITPTTISALLKLVGTITIGGIDFTSENFTTRLQEYVDKGFKTAGLDERQRKDIIGLMTKELVDRLMKLPIANWKDVFLVLSQQLNTKQMLFYMKDTAVQSLLVQQNWAGAIDQTQNADSLLVVDANLASLKTDSVIQRTYSYSINLDGDRPVATLTIHYTHTGKFDWRTSYLISRYNTYVRVYVPNGSELLSSSGAQLKQQSTAVGKVETSTELGKTVFAAFKSVEPGTVSDLKLTYRLPSSIAERVRSGTYELRWQKQPGLATPDIIFDVTSKKASVRANSGLDNEAKISHSSLSFMGQLQQDRTVTVMY